MILLVEANVLTVGLNGSSGKLNGLPIRLINMQTGSDAIKCLRNERIDSVISEWDLPDMVDGSFLKSFKSARPHMPTIAVIKPGNRKQEVAARSLGVAAVLTDDSSPEHFKATICQILGLNTEDVKAIRVVKNQDSESPVAIKEERG